SDRTLARSFGTAGRLAVEANWSLDRMVTGYARLICETYDRKRPSIAFGDAQTGEKPRRIAAE
ncbi:MAG TPA: hypothetical protein VMM76_03535, partial [Pirellulaceae bacterium]|nr:hypothetical protein [Pirellulaceae bacterium]